MDDLVPSPQSLLLSNWNPSSHVLARVALTPSQCLMYNLARAKMFLILVVCPFQAHYILLSSSLPARSARSSFQADIYMYIAAAAKFS